MRVLSSTDISQLLLKLSDDQFESMHRDLHQGLSEYSRQQNHSSTTSAKIIQPLRTVITTRENITSLTMPVSDTNFTSVKTVTVPPDAPIKGAITVFSAKGDLLGLLNAAEVTAFRTALTSMLALSHSKWGHKSTSAAKSSDKHNLVVFGGGKQAEWHIRLALRFSTIRTVTVVNRSRQRLQDLEDHMLKDLRASHSGLTVHCLVQENHRGYNEELREILSHSDIICCTTPSTSPLFPASDLRQPPKSRFISLIGSYKPSMQEIDTETLFSGFESKIIVDAREACLEEAGELIRADVSADRLVEIGELYIEGESKHSAEEEHLLAPASDNVIFKCVGLSLMDLVVSRSLLDISKQNNVGTEMAF